MALVVCVPVLVLFFRQHAMIYHPRPYPAGCEAWMPKGAVEFSYTIAAGRQTAFYLHAGNQPEALPDRLWVLFCGNGSFALDWTTLAKRDRNPGDAFILIDYPGYGRCEGVATIANTRASAERALAALADRLGVREDELEPRLAVGGHSLGAAAALDFAAKHPVSRVFLAAPFTTLREEAARVVGGTLSHLLLENYDNRARLRELEHRANPPRVAIFHGTNDDLIPVSMGRELAAAWPGKVDFFAIEGADHGGIVDEAGDEIVAWMNAK